ncbi:MAG: chromosome partitioning protein ParA [Proteobacteria bacterium]|nr:MAG: chromosome partitioning protein ParA [Pseudomonadota bacterium]
MGSRARVLVVANQKGGVGKTTTAVNLAASFAVSERRTLLIDLDPQANASSGLGIAAASTQIYDALIGRCALKDVTQPTELEFLRVAPSGSDLVGAEIELVGAEQREHRLARALDEARADYDVVLIDCPPSLGLLTLNALTAADAVLVPLQAEYYALEGLARLLDTIELVRQGLNPSLELEGVVLTMMDARNNLSRQVADEVRSHLGDRVFATEIPRNVRLSEAPSHGRPALLYDVRSKGSTAYLQVAEEILRRQAARAPAPGDGR